MKWLINPKLLIIVRKNLISIGDFYYDNKIPCKQQW